MGLLDRRLLFSCLVVGIFAIIFLQGSEAKGGGRGGGGGGRSSGGGRKSSSSSKSTYKYNNYYHTSGYHGGYSSGSSGKTPWSWWKFWLILMSVFGIGLLVVMLYCLCCNSPDTKEDEQAARVAIFLNHQEEQLNSDLPTTVHPPVTCQSPDNEPPSAPAMTPPPQYPGWGSSDSPSFPPPDFASATAPLLLPKVQPVDSSTNPPPGAPTLSSSTAHTTPPQIGFIIPPQDPANASVHFGGRVGAE
ncbi:uncharacterized protein LOC135940821 [Cloeon dipterum]|uniref:uncharacterized protein LOC135940821 n=1 Tax=Cloeon dipterum TaxID=197152 RepID=UPI00321FC2A1